MNKPGLGHYDKQGNACLKFNLRGVRHSEPGPEFTGIIDTGFTGFLQIPIAVAMALALPLEGTVGVTLADGSQSIKLTAQAIATVSVLDTRLPPQLGIVVLETASDQILIGMEFLRQFNLGLLLAKDTVLLFPQEKENPKASF